ncbi:MAG: 50S ribosomal protein L11 methyltransferase [Mesotoga sp.]|nr:50S ribosomal protein L11 methyltransferase [Mesotoga sp.]
MKYRHLVVGIKEEQRDLFEAWSWEEGFMNLYFEELPDMTVTLHVILAEGEELPEFLTEVEFVDLGFSSEEDWYEKWRQTLRPFSLCGGITVVPMEEERPVESLSEIGLIPGMAFGTGLHESTRLAASLIKKVVRSGDRVLDVGCGTGILSVLAMKCGASEAIALDIDEHALEKTRETARINGVSVKVVKSDFLSALSEGESFDLIIANMIAELLERFAGDMKKFLRKSGSIVLSGIYREKIRSISKLIDEDFTIDDTEEDGDWKALLLKER